MNRKMRILSIFLCVLMLGATFVTVAGAAYTYSYNGEYRSSPDAYVADRVVTNTTMGLADPLNKPKDIEVGHDGRVYISDTGNNRVVICNPDFLLEHVITTFVNEHGVTDTFKGNQGLFVTETELYVCDTSNNRIVVFDIYDNYAFKKIIYAPKAEVIEDGSIFRPIAVSVDASGKMYIISDSTYNGVIAMNPDGSFQGYIGAQRAVVSAFDLFWRKFMTSEQISKLKQNIPTTYNNIDMDKDGFIYVTTNNIEEATQQAAINSRSNSGDYAPVKKLNASGIDIMIRNGFFPPSGEVNVQMQLMAGESNVPYGASSIVDVAIGDNGMWSIIDAKRQKIYTYDSNGVLLFIFGDTGSMLGNTKGLIAICYKGTDILLLDESLGSVTVQKRTAYGDTLSAALKNTMDRKYSESVVYWKEILKQNNNFDAAYVGIGDSLYREGKYTEAMEYYRDANDVQNYSNAFRENRKEILKKYVVLVPVVVVVLCIVIFKFFKYAGKVNRRGETKTTKRTLWEELLFGFHILFHPFDGFWDLKHEKRGSVRAAIIYVALACLTMVYKTVGTAYIFSPNRNPSFNVFFQIATILAPLLLWCVANWCLTTLFDGEGSFKDIFVASSYALLPFILLITPITLCTNIMCLDEQSLMNLIQSFAFIWMGLLIFFGTSVTHDYTVGKNILITLCTILGMAFILFLILLFSNLVSQMVSFIAGIVTELSYR